MIIHTLYDLDHKGEMRDTNELVLRWREKVAEQWVRRERIVKDFEPYLYVERDSVVVVKNKDEYARKVLSSTVHEQEGIEWAITGQTPSSKVTADGKELDKVTFKSPGLMRMVSNKLKPTYEADVPYEDRYLVDCVNEIPDYKMRKLFIDLEALQFKQHDDGPHYCNNTGNPRDFQEINVIGAYDSFTKQRVQWCQHGDYKEETKVHTFDGNDCIVHYFHNEKSLLQHFVNFVDAVDPDCILAWGMGFYDLPTLYYRLESCGIGAAALSPSSLGSKRHMVKPRFRGNQYRWTQQPVVGRLVISLDMLFERVYRDSKSANLPSNKLDVVGEKLFGRGKTDFRPDFYDADYDKFMDNYLYYNYRDVELMVEIETKYNLIEGQQALQQLARCQFNSTFYGSSYARVYFMRKANFIQKTGWQETHDDELQGAIIMDPEELGSIGLHKNVVILDFAGLYPSIMIAYNTSFETKVKPGEEREDDIIGDGCRFRREPVGLLPKCVMELDVLRDKYKAKRADAANTHGKGSDEYRKWDDAQKTVKRLRATFFGLMGFGRHGYAWGDIDIARTITYGGRNALMFIKDECEVLGYPVIYGHTDSIFVKLGDDKTPEECAKIAEELGEHLTGMCQDQIKSEAIVVEAELIMDRFYLPRRNKYAGRIVWMPDTGESPFDIGKLPVDSRIKMQGLEAKHTNTAPIGREVQIEAMKMIWDDKRPQEVLSYVQGVIQQVRDGDIPVTDLIARGRVGMWLPSQLDYIYDHYSEAATNRRARADAKEVLDKAYANLAGDKKGAAWHNIVLANDTFPKMDRGDSYNYTYVKDGPTWFPEGGYVAFHELTQIADYTLDIEKIIEKNIIGKLDHIMYGIGLSNDMLRPPTDKFDGRELSIEDFQ